MINPEHPDPEDQLLERQLQQLPREIEPGRDLWPGIEQSLQRPGRRLPALAAAAVMLLACAGLLVHLKYQVPGEQIAGQPAGAQVGVWEQQSVELQKVRSGLQPVLQQQLAQMDPETRRVVLENLVIIEQARVNIRDALQQQPHNAVLSNQYQRLWRQEMAIYQRVSGYSYKM